MGRPEVEGPPSRLDTRRDFGFRSTDHTGAQELHIFGGNKGVTADPQPARPVMGPQIHFAPLDAVVVGFQEFHQLTEHGRRLPGRRSNQGDIVGPSRMRQPQNRLAVVTKLASWFLSGPSADTAYSGKLIPKPRACHDGGHYLVQTTFPEGRHLHNPLSPSAPEGEGGVGVGARSRDPHSTLKLQSQQRQGLRWPRLCHARLATSHRSPRSRKRPRCQAGRYKGGRRIPGFSTRMN